jgi:DNA-directed RNA polymerase sigma subunit (sigma70/sigma32)
LLFDKSLAISVALSVFSWAVTALKLLWLFQFLNLYLTSLLKKHLDDREFDVLRLSYGLDCDKHSANDIAEQLGIEGASAYVRISEIKKQAIAKLVANVDSSQVLDFL